MVRDRAGPWMCRGKIRTLDSIPRLVWSLASVGVVCGMLARCPSFMQSVHNTARIKVCLGLPSEGDYADPVVVNHITTAKTWRRRTGNAVVDDFHACLCIERGGTGGQRTAPSPRTGSGRSIVLPSAGRTASLSKTTMVESIRLPTVEVWKPEPYEARSVTSHGPYLLSGSM